MESPLEFVNHRFNGRPKKELSHQESVTYNGVRILTEFLETGQVNVPLVIRKPPLVFKGPLSQSILSFIDYKENQERLSLSSLRNYRRGLFHFMQYCNNNISSLKEVDLPLILKYIQELDAGKTFAVVAISSLRNFLKYAFEQQLIDIDYAIKIPSYRRVQQPKVPATYTKEEIEKLIASVERSSPIGKRNYAVILLAARLGLRASDICRLKFEHLNWDTNTIELEQVKTGRPLVLPMLPDVGNAIIDYLKYGRRSSKASYVFLTERPPYGHFMTSNVVTHVVQRAFKKSGVSTKDKRFGPHALRHSLGFRMLQESEALPVISEVLGHKSTKSTRYYLRIDLASMQQCMLEVPAITNAFYEQKGGFFYE